MQKNEVVATVTNFISRGKLQLALGKLKVFCDGFPEHAELKELGQEVVFQLSRLSSIEERMVQGLISTENGFVIENNIRLAAVKLNEQLAAVPIAPAVLESQVTAQQENRQLIGNWKCTYRDPNWMNNSEVVSTWMVFPNNTMQSLFHDKETGTFIEKTELLKWSFKDGIYYETAADGTPGKAIVEWISEDQITLTIIDGFEVIHDGLRKVFHRIN